MLKKLLILSVLSFSVFAQAKQSLINRIEKGATVHEIQTAIQEGSDINARKGIFSEKRSVLMIAIKNKRPEIAKLLIDAGADVNAKNKDGQTALIYAAQTEYAEIAKLLIDAGADVNAKNKNRQTPLMYAALYAQSHIVKILLERGAYVNARDIAGQTALFMAYVKGFKNRRFSKITYVDKIDYQETIQLLLQAGAIQ